MVATPSTMLPLGTQVPEFSLPDVVTGKTVSSRELSEGKAALVMFICNHCPFVKHVMDELGRLGEDYVPQGVRIVAINSNDVETYPQDDAENMRDLATTRRWRFPFLLDEEQDVAKSFRAACTPDFFVFDGGGRLVYRGQLDESRPNNEVAVTGRDLRGALDAVLAGRAVSSEQIPSLGCNIKWKHGKQPDYFG
ncbi:MAG: thioredoxin family protein [Candidatus Eisenbacteria bacterium]|uniref:Thioredoxin family protein n=1 Tax=Eiseniibacteriota bacterium TaxID=2212470 RepID=A0A956M2V0_UNCEI|nr:thioredoxin family protein [Candidatus Eisenbacteria bacterium]